MKVHNCLTEFGTIEKKRISVAHWENMHQLREDYISKKTFAILKRFNQPLTIFNASVMEKYGYLPLPAHPRVVSKLKIIRSLIAKTLLKRLRR